MSVTINTQEKTFYKGFVVMFMIYLS